MRIREDSIRYFNKMFSITQEKYLDLKKYRKEVKTASEICSWTEVMPNTHKKGFPYGSKFLSKEMVSTKVAMYGDVRVWKKDILTEDRTRFIDSQVNNFLTVLIEDCELDDLDHEFIRQMTDEYGLPEWDPEPAEAIHQVMEYIRTVDELYGTIYCWNPNLSGAVTGVFKLEARNMNLVVVNARFGDFQAGEIVEDSIGNTIAVAAIAMPKPGTPLQILGISMSEGIPVGRLRKRTNVAKQATRAADIDNKMQMNGGEENAENNT